MLGIPGPVFIWWSEHIADAFWGRWTSWFGSELTKHMLGSGPYFTRVGVRTRVESRT